MKCLEIDYDAAHYAQHDESIRSRLDQIVEAAGGQFTGSGMGLGHRDFSYDVPAQNVGAVAQACHEVVARFSGRVLISACS